VRVGARARRGGARRRRSARPYRARVRSPPPQRVAPSAPARRDRAFARARRAPGAHRGQRARLRAHAAGRARRRRPGTTHRRRSGVIPGAAHRWRGLVHLCPRAGSRSQPAHGPARTRRVGGRRTGAIHGTRTRTALAVAAAGRIHDDLVTPRRAAARVDLSHGAVAKRAARSQAMSHTRGSKARTKPQAAARAAEIVREYGPFAGADRINGVTHDGRRVWAATGSKLLAFDPESGQLARTLERAGDAGTAFDGTHLYQIAAARIDKIDPATGDVVASIPAPGNGGDSGLAWAEGSLWVGQYRDRKIHQIDPRT